MEPFSNIPLVLGPQSPCSSCSSVKEELQWWFHRGLLEPSYHKTSRQEAPTERHIKYSLKVFCDFFQCQSTHHRNSEAQSPATHSNPSVYSKLCKKQVFRGFKTSTEEAQQWCTVPILQRQGVYGSCRELTWPFESQQQVTPRVTTCLSTFVLGAPKAVLRIFKVDPSYLCTGIASGCRYKKTPSHWSVHYKPGTALVHPTAHSESCPDWHIQWDVI